MIDIEAVKAQIVEEAKSLDWKTPSRSGEKFPCSAIMPLKLHHFEPIVEHLPTSSKDGVHYKELARYDDRHFVHQAYLGILRHPADPQGENMYLQRLRNGMSKAEIMVRLRYSTEGKLNAVKLRGMFLPALGAFIRKIPIIGKIWQSLVDLVCLSQSLSNIQNELHVINDHIRINEKLIQDKVNESLIRINHLAHLMQK